MRGRSRAARRRPCRWRRRSRRGRCGGWKTTTERRSEMEQQPSDGSGAGEVAAGRGRRRTDDQAGTLVLIGGACDPAGEAFGRFVELAKGRDGGRIVGLTTA